MKPDTILILDFGGQYCHLIGRRIREEGVYSEIVPNNISAKDIKNLGQKLKIKGLILSGGPASVYERNSPKMARGILNLPLPILGICYGHQLLTHYLKGKVRKAEEKEYGISFATIKNRENLFHGLKKQEKIWMSHGDSVIKIPRNCKVLAQTKDCPVAAFRVMKKPIFGIQWHPEVIHTKNGTRIFKNFIFDICQCSKNWRVKNLAKKLILEIKKSVGSEKAIIALSGGIDSSTATTLAAKSLGKNLIAVFVDHGLMRENEPEQIKDTFRNSNINFKYIKTKNRFFKKLRGVKNPEKKRKIIGREFIKVFEEIARKTGAEYLIQGTIYPDIIESGSLQRAERIKTHHNVAGIPTKIKFKGIIEPLKDLYKDEVRKLAQSLGVPKEIVFRQPFPGPGLAVRIIGAVAPGKIKIIRKADQIVREEIEISGFNKNIWQYFPVLLDIKTTGVKGDQRSYGYTLAIRAIESKEAMTANFAKMSYPVLERISTRITNEIPQVTRVVYDITNKPPATIEWE